MSYQNVVGIANLISSGIRLVLADFRAGTNHFETRSTNQEGKVLLTHLKGGF